MQPVARSLRERYSGGGPEEAHPPKTVRTPDKLLAEGVFFESSQGHYVVVTTEGAHLAHRYYGSRADLRAWLEALGAGVLGGEGLSALQGLSSRREPHCSTGRYLHREARCWLGPCWVEWNGRTLTALYPDSSEVLDRRAASPATWRQRAQTLYGAQPGGWQESDDERPLVDSTVKFMDDDGSTKTGRVIGQEVEGGEIYLKLDGQDELKQITADQLVDPSAADLEPVGELPQEPDDLMGGPMGGMPPGMVDVDEDGFLGEYNPDEDPEEPVFPDEDEEGEPEADMGGPEESDEDEEEMAVDDNEFLDPPQTRRRGRPARRRSHEEVVADAERLLQELDTGGVGGGLERPLWDDPVRPPGPYGRSTRRRKRRISEAAIDAPRDGGGRGRREATPPGGFTDEHFINMLHQTWDGIAYDYLAATGEGLWGNEPSEGDYGEADGAEVQEAVAGNITGNEPIAKAWLALPLDRKVELLNTAFPPKQLYGI